MKMFGKVILALVVCVVIGSAVSAAAHVPAHYPYPYDYAVPYPVMAFEPYMIDPYPYPHPYTYPYPFINPYPTPYPVFITVDFDVNNVADERIIKTFPLSIADRNFLEIQFRGAFNFYKQGKYKEALEMFSDQSKFWGNYLFLYWAGMCEIRLNNKTRATEFFHKALEINPHYEPAKREVSMGR